MGKKQVDKYTCDVIDCNETKEWVPNQLALNDIPAGWIPITLGRIRGHNNVHMWLCPTHSNIIDKWCYNHPTENRSQ